MLLCPLFVKSEGALPTYFLNEWSQRNTLNASFAPKYAYYSLPIIGRFDFHFSSNTGLSNYLYKFPDLAKPVTFLHKKVNGQQFIDKLDENTFFNQDLKINLISFGFPTKKGFWSFNYSMKEEFNLNLPIDLFKLMKLGFAAQTNLFDLKNFSIEQSNISECSLGYSNQINPKLRIGVNAKLLMGLSVEKVKYTQFDISLENDRYSVNAVGESLLMSNILSFEKDKENYYEYSKYGFNLFGNPSGIGAAFDIGLSYKPIEKLTIAAAVNDIGYIKWNANSVKRGAAKGDLIFTGFNEVSIETLDIQTQLNQLLDDAGRLIKFKEISSNQNLVENIPYTVNLSAEYSIFGNTNSDILLGFLWNSYNSSAIHENELVAAINFKPFSSLTISTTAGMHINDGFRYGLAMNFSPKWINFFIASNFMPTSMNPQFLPVNKFNINLQTGVSFLLDE